MGVELDARPRERIGHLQAAGAGKRRHVAGHVHGPRPRLRGEPRERPLGPLATDDQPRSALTQRRIEIAQALEHELRPVARGEAPVQQPVIEEEDGHDTLVALERGVQGRVVSDPKVAPEPYDRRVHALRYGAGPAGDQARGRARAGSLAVVGDRIERFPLFPLGLVLLPSEMVPLHMFEERYKRMVDECLDEGAPFGIVWLSDAGLKDVGCTAEIARLIDRMEDGRLNILVQGTRPFRLLRRIDDLPYPAGDIELVDEPPSEADADVEAAARERYADLVERATDSRPDEQDLAQLDAYGMAASIDFEAGPKQELLELRSEDERLRRLTELLRTTMKRLDYAERAQELSRSNGKVRR